MQQSRPILTFLFFLFSSSLSDSFFYFYPSTPFHRCFACCPPTRVQVTKQFTRRVKYRISLIFNPLSNRGKPFTPRVSSALSNAIHTRNICGSKWSIFNLFFFCRFLKSPPSIIQSLRLNSTIFYYLFVRFKRKKKKKKYQWITRGVKPRPAKLCHTRYPSKDFQSVKHIL